MNEKNKKLWLELYSIADKILKLEPCQKLTDNNLLMYISNKNNDVYYFATMGGLDLYKGIIVFDSKEVGRYLKFSNNDYPLRTLRNYQEGILCNFCRRDNISNENKKIIKELGLKFRGTWIAFEKFEKGYEAYSLDIEQVKIAIDAFTSYYEMVKNIIENDIKIDFEAGKTLLRIFDKENQCFIDNVTDIFFPDSEFNVIQISDYLKNQLKEIPKTELSIEYEFLNYLPIKLKELKEKDGKTKFPRMRILADRKTGYILMHDLIKDSNYKDEADYVLESLDKLIEFITKYGRPKEIYVRDEETKALLSDLESGIDIKMKLSPRLDAIDGAYDLFDLM